jgi:hypothetical protein
MEDRRKDLATCSVVGEKFLEVKSEFHPAWSIRVSARNFGFANGNEPSLCTQPFVSPV